MTIDNPLGFLAFEHLDPNPSLEPWQPDVASKLVVMVSTSHLPYAALLHYSSCTLS